MFKLALNAGHYKGTSKGVPAGLSPTGRFINEWSLNARVADKIEAKLQAYDGYELTRLDDPTGENDVSLEDRAAKANEWPADFYLSVHHNGGMKGGSGGGIVAYVYTSVGAETLAWQTELYNALADATGLIGNRSVPLAKSNLFECRETNMPAVLLELGFMDSTTDVPVIVEDEYAERCADAIVKVIASHAGLTKKPEPALVTGNKLYRVQVGAFKNKKYADDYAAKIRADGYDAFVVEVGTEA